MPFGDNFKFIFKFVLMCICLLYVCVSKLADALKMGNKQNRFGTNKKSYHGCKNQYQVRISEEDYLPMTRNMHFHHGGRTTTIKTPSDKGQCKNVRSNNVLDKNIRIINNNNGNACIDVKVKQQSPPNTTSVISSSPMLSRKTSYDYTNAHIRNMFRYSNSPGVEEIYKNPSCEEPSVGNIPSKLGRPSLYRCVAKKSTSRRLSHRSSKNKCGVSSTYTSSSFVSSSSLSTIISYKRVRRIFKTIIEGKQVRRRNKIEISKFKEMEELGLVMDEGTSFCRPRWSEKFITMVLTTAEAPIKEADESDQPRSSPQTSFYHSDTLLSLPQSNRKELTSLLQEALTTSSSQPTEADRIQPPLQSPSTTERLLAWNP
ncbi:uncharacterized protein LOC128991658 [Macrosteles quadrilineatus]|uniref:uncharacterized protein LOC128991658 n=1 Tax=Macrosteles quadrilineatus TaxID=74068 RepID=UPI0023E1CBA0|nr:uncharacterized protein LOC128991658 [Macrosteles quadrilineatus]